MSGAHLFASGGPYKSGGTLAAHDTTSFDFFLFFFFLPCSVHSTEVRFVFFSVQPIDYAHVAGKKYSDRFIWHRCNDAARSI